MQKKYFGHWEIDTLIGTKTKDDSVLLTLVERKTRFKIMLKIHQKSKEFVNKAMKQLYERIGNLKQLICSKQLHQITVQNSPVFTKC